LSFAANHFPCVCLQGKSRLTSGHENVIHVTSDNLDDFKIIQISNISVSFVEKKTKKLKIPNGKGNFGITSTTKILFRILYKLCGRLRFFSSIKDVRMLKFPLFLKSLLNLAKFDGKFIGICKHLLSVVRLRSLRFS